MLSLLLAAALQVQDRSTQGDRPPQWHATYGDVFKRTTGDNGYEEYVRAGDLLSNPEAGLFITYENYLQQKDAGVAVEAQDVPPLPPSVTPEMTCLEVQREHVRRFGGALDIVDRGNGKQVYDPREKVEVATTFPELARLKAIAKFGIVDMKVCLADGLSNRATAAAVTLLTMRAKLPATMLITELVGIAIDSIVLAAVNENTDHFSEKDWIKMGDIADRRLGVSSIAATLQSEMQFQMQSVGEIIKPDVMGAFWSGDDQDNTALSNAYAALSPAQRDRLVAALRSRIQAGFNSMQDRLKGPEAHWADGEDREPAKFDGSFTGLVDSFADMLSPVYSQFFQAEVKNRTQMRLLKLHSEIQRFRWHHNRLPKTLGEAAPKDCVDPLTTEPFIYTPNGFGGYRLASKGIKQTGEIELKYKRGLVPASDSGDPPPP